MNNPLEKELHLFQENKAEWAKIYPDKYVLVKGQDLIGAFDTPEAALSEGAKRFGSTSFLVKKVNQTEDNVFIPSLSLGLLYATP
jgi:hypothetical protein